MRSANPGYLGIRANGVKLVPAGLRKNIVVDTTQVENRPGKISNSFSFISVKDAPHPLRKNIWRNAPQRSLHKRNELWSRRMSDEAAADCETWHGYCEDRTDCKEAKSSRQRTPDERVAQDQRTNSRIRSDPNTNRPREGLRNDDAVGGERVSNLPLENVNRSFVCRVADNDRMNSRWRGSYEGCEELTDSVKAGQEYCG